jgi:glycosyltransferase involved in cell wall biosynthesis
MSGITVIVPVKDDPLIFQCVESILRAERGEGEFEVLVVENGSTEAFRASLAQLRPPVRVLHSERLGPAAARNLAVREARGEVLFFTDADCEVDPGWLREGLEGLRETGAELVRGHSQSLTPGRGARLTAAYMDWLRSRQVRRSRQKGRGGRPIPDTKNLAVRKCVLEELPFDEELLRFEDVSLGFRAAARGMHIAVWAPMVVNHFEDETFKLRVAKSIVDGWAAREFDRLYPGLRPRARQRRRLRRTRLVDGAGRRLMGLPGAFRACGRLELALAVFAEHTAGRLPGPLGAPLVRPLGRFAELTGDWSHDVGFARVTLGDLFAHRIPMKPPRSRA